jgi:hypothetical protein
MIYNLSAPIATGTHEIQRDLFQIQIRLPACGRSSHAFCEATLITSSELIHCGRCDCVAPYITATSCSCCHA